jgi:hypothetical protein
MYKVRATYLWRPGMVFDLDYYFRVHVPLAQAQTRGRVNIRRIEVESETTLLLDRGVTRSPCAFSMYFDTAEDVARYLAFFRSDGVAPLRDDVPNYTNCELEWTVSKVHDVV